MTEQNQQQRGKTLWAIADHLRGTSQQLLAIKQTIETAKQKHNGFLSKLVLPLLP